MTLTSMNPRGSAHSECVLSEHTLKILQPLLRSLAMWHRERTRLVPLDPDLEFDDLKVEETADSEPPTSDDINRALNGPYAAVPAASTMTKQEIEDAIAGGRDPLAEGLQDQGTASLHLPPVPSMITAARFAAMLSDAKILSEVTVPRAFSLISIPDRQERKAVWKSINNVLQRLADLSEPSDDTWRGFETPVCAEETNWARGHSSSKSNDYEDAVDAAITKGHKILALAPDAKPMSPLTRAMCGQVLDWPPLTRQMVIEILRVTHTSTGELSVNELVKLLPPDSDITALPPAVIEGAFLENTTLKVAKAIATASARLQTLPPIATTLNDIVLNDNVRAPVNRLIADIAAWKTGQLNWAEVSSSVLFYGAPGNGKTLLACAIAGSLNIPLVATSYSDCQRHGHQGDMLKALSDKVDEAVRAAPSVFFLDEVDSFTHRDRPGRRSDYIVGVVNGLLEHLSRLNNTPGLIVLGATNFPDMIDPAILRPGRFDLKVELSNPDKAAILRMLRLALGDDADAVTVDQVAVQLLGSSGAQIAALVREARGLARSKQMPLNQSHLETAAARVCPALSPDVIWRVAVHEAGHVVVGHVLGLPVPNAAAITGFGGFVTAADVGLHTLDTALDQITTLLAGHAAESTVLGRPSNGSGLGINSDLSRATALAANVLFHWGLDNRLTHILSEPALQLGSGDHDGGRIEATLQKQRTRAVQIIEDHREVVERVAKALRAHRELGKDDIRALLNPKDNHQTDRSLMMEVRHDA